MKIIFAAAAAMVVLAAPVSAGVVFDNPFDGIGGDCVFNTNCGSVFSGDTYAGQLFTLSSATSLTGASFTAVDQGVDPTQPASVNWRIHAADLNAGLPSSLIASGNSVIDLRALSAIQGGFNGTVFDYSYGLPSVSLGAGSYYFAFQAVSSVFAVYLGSASPLTGAVQSNDGGTTWQANYQNFTGVAMSLSDGASGAVPEPASWAMLIAGFGLVGAAARRRRQVSLVA
jgi:hypothetical protein